MVGHIEEGGEGGWRKRVLRLPALFSLTAVASVGKPSRRGVFVLGVNDRGSQCETVPFLLIASQGLRYILFAFPPRTLVTVT